MTSAERIRKLVISNYKLSILFWSIIFLIAIPIVPQFFDKVIVNYDAPEGTDAANAQKVIEKEFPEAENSNHIVLIQMKDESMVINDDVGNFTTNLLNEINSNNKLSKYVSSEDVLGYYVFLGTEIDQASPDFKFQFISNDQKTTYIVIRTADEGDYDLSQELATEIRHILNNLEKLFPNTNLILTGMPAISLDSNESLRHDMERIDLIIIPLIIIILWIILRNPRLVPIPLLGIFVTLIIAFAIMGLVADHMIILNFVPNVMISIGLGVGVDYSLFLLSRFKEERDQQVGVIKAIDDMLTHAGHTITVSGLTLAVAFFGLILFPVASLSSVGIAIAVTVLVSLAINLTLIPAVLRITGEWLTPVKVKNEIIEVEGSVGFAKAYWRTLANFSSKYAIPILILVTLIAIPISSQVLNMTQGFDTTDIAAEGSESRNGLKILQTEFTPGITGPVSIVITPQDGIWSEEYFNLSHEFISVLAGMNEVNPTLIMSHTWMGGEPVPYDFAITILPLFLLGEEELNAAIASYPEEIRNSIIVYLSLAPAYISKDGNTARIEVALAIDPVSKSARTWVNTLCDKTIPSILGPYDYEVAVAGNTAETNDMLSRTYELFPYMILLVLLTIACIVGLMYRSVFVPIRLLGTVLLSISFVYGLAVLFFEENWGVIFEGGIIRPSISETQGLFWMVPVMSFSILVGLGMDYDLFILGRIREEVWKGKTTREAIADALQHTGGIVTGAAAIMVIAFSGLMLSSTIILVEFGFILAIAVLIDATLVRTFLVPAIMSVAENSNWWPSSPPIITPATEGTQTQT